MNRVYNNEGIIMACIVHILRERDMDIVLLYLVSTKLLQKSGIRKNEVIELIYRGFI